MPLSLQRKYILGMRVDATSYADAGRQVLDWARHHESRYICAADMHMVMESHYSREFRDIVNGADLVTPDGMPLVWACSVRWKRPVSTDLISPRPSWRRR